MSKTLTLKPRNKQGEVYAWHDSYVLQTALNHIATGKPISKAGLWFNIATKVQYAQEESNPKQSNLNVELQIELKNVEARLLCVELSKMKVEQFGRNHLGQPSTPPLAPLFAMLSDFEKELEHTIMSVDEENDDEDD